VAMWFRNCLRSSIFRFSYDFMLKWGMLSKGKPKFSILRQTVMFDVFSKYLRTSLHPTIGLSFKNNKSWIIIVSVRAREIVSFNFLQSHEIGIWGANS